MNRLLVACWSGMGNLGDDWLMQSALELLGRDNDCAVLLEPPARPPDAFPGRVLRWPLIKTAPAGELRSFRAALRSFDAVVFAGGGWLADDQGFRSTARWAARMAVVPSSLSVYGLGIGLGPFTTRIGVAAARRVVDRMDRVSVRTDSDGRWAGRLGVRDVDLFGDWCLRDWGERAQSPRSGHVVIAPIAQSRWCDAPHVVERRLATTVEQDGGRFLVLDASDVRTPDDARPSSVAVALSAIGAAEKVTSMRLHGAIAAAALDVDLTAVGYHHKFEVLEQVGVTVVPVDSFVPTDAPVSRVDHLALRAVTMRQDSVLASLGLRS